jgi:flagellar hook-associated protein 3 FlgL
MSTPVTPATSLALSQELLGYLDAGQSSVQQLEAELSSGSSILAPSDDPPGAQESLAAQAAAAQAANWVSNAQDGISRLGLANQVLNQVLDQVSQAQQAVQSVSTATFSPAGTAALAQQVQGIAQEILANANTTYEGYAIFAGTSGQAEAFSASGAYLGNANVPTRTVGAGIQIPAALAGDTIFGNGPSSLFGVLNQTAADLQSGNVQAVLSTDLPALNSWYSQVQGSAAQVGSLYDQMQAAQQQAEATAAALSTQASNLTGVDLAGTATELSLKQSTLQAALYSLAHVVPESLLPYLP